MTWRQTSARLSLTTRGQGLTDITSRVSTELRESLIRDGAVTLFVQHTSASLIIQENADPDVLSDLLSAFDRLAPRQERYRHAAEGPDDMPAHIRSALTATSLTIPILSGALTLGPWQGIYLFEHRDRPHQRQVICQFIGEV
ncbi:hypothetical protein PB2503_08654 [Parvularcula bermudensis HTCC2503]|uniref:Secondary thiamine-phosphate synthase enzyme n=1 Tax=Parvularcula bermudensis (strain ATCC BAA-594 / HTCC2503 / KCTC 12087) TaxID=314260 RepID=E0TBR5_PARBH|nr:secondary thiamine-phosphate synthase enzyme YjbQ [Parvularcula bermudensis]ADM09786.1 hypothetical protein PB2503_08654 [Parvularcula bermudensis HTCC2503]